MMMVHTLHIPLLENNLSTDELLERWGQWKQPGKKFFFWSKK